MKTLTDEQFTELFKRLRDIAARTKKGAPYNHACEAMEILQRAGDAHIAFQKLSWDNLRGKAESLCDVTSKQAIASRGSAGSHALDFVRHTGEKPNEYARRESLLDAGRAEAYEAAQDFIRDLLDTVRALEGHCRTPMQTEQGYSQGQEATGKRKGKA